MWMWPNDPAVTHSAHLPQRGTEGGDRGGGVLRAEEEKVGFRSGVGAKCSGGSGVLEQLRTEWRKERMRLHANFEFTFAQMCCLVPKSFSGFAPPTPIYSFFMSSPFFTNTTHTNSHKHTHTNTSGTKCTPVSLGLIYPEAPCRCLLKPEAISGFLW